MTANPFTVYPDGDNPNDVVIIGGWQLPGLAKLGSPKRTFKWDDKEAPGTGGDTITFRGKRLCDLVVELSWWDASQADEWDSNSSILEPNGKTGLDIVHPTAERLKIKSVVVTEIVAPFHAGGGLWKTQIGLKEYGPPKPNNLTSTPDGSKSGSGNDGKGKTTTTPTAKTAQEEEIARLLAEARKP